MAYETPILYSIGCPLCNVLKMKLDAKGIAYEINDSEEDLLALGFTAAPVLFVGGKYMMFVEANDWVNNQ